MPIAGINVFGPADGRALRSKKEEVGLMLFLLFGLLILAATGHLILH